MQRGAKHQGLELACQHHGQNERQGSALTADLPLEGCAAGAAIDVGACDAPGEGAAVRRCQPLPDLCARMLPRPPSTDQRLTCLEYECLDLLFAHPEHGGDFFVRMIPKLEENERGTLVGRQPLQVIQHLAKVLPPLDLICHTFGGGSICRHFVEIEIAAGAELRQAAVARDRIQPRPERYVGVAPAQRAKRRDERQLKHVLGRLPISQHVHAEREHPASVSIVDRLERSIVACTQPRHKVLVNIAHDGPAIEATAEPGDCRVHPHGHSVRYRAPKVQRLGDLATAAGSRRCAAPSLMNVPRPVARGRPGGAPGNP